MINAQSVLCMTVCARLHGPPREILRIDEISGSVRASQSITVSIGSEYNLLDVVHKKYPVYNCMRYEIIGRCYESLHFAKSDAYGRYDNHLI